MFIQEVIRVFNIFVYKYSAILYIQEVIRFFIFSGDCFGGIYVFYFLVFSSVNIVYLQDYDFFQFLGFSSDILKLRFYNFLFFKFVQLLGEQF